jgi:hypothetical protein
MSIPEFNNLFRDSGPQGMLELLFSKIEADDLSADEALAMLSAVHKELGQRAGTDTKAFQLYASFMKLLQKEKPDVYNHVVSSWNQRNKAESSEEDHLDTNVGEAVASDSNLHGAEPNSESEFGIVKVAEGVSNEEEEPEEPGEIEEKETNQLETIEKIGDGDESEKTDEEESEEEEGDQADDKREVQEESDQDKAEDPIEETEVPQEENESEENADPDDNDSESSEEEGANDVNDESRVGSDKGEPEGEGELQQGETEWPEVEQAQSDEQFDGLEVDDEPSQSES